MELVWIQPDAGADSHSLALSHALADTEVLGSIRCRAVSCMYTAGHVVGCIHTHPRRCDLSFAASARDGWHVWIQPNAGSDCTANTVSHAHAEVRPSIDRRATSGMRLHPHWKRVHVFNNATSASSVGTHRRQSVSIQPDAGPTHDLANIHANTKRHINPSPSDSTHSLSDLDAHAKVRLRALAMGVREFGMFAQSHAVADLHADS